VYATAVEHGLEGVVCKRMRSTYQPGRRSPDWFKTTVQLTTEVVIVGWQPGQGRRAGGIGSLLLTAHDSTGRLVYTRQGRHRFHPGHAHRSGHPARAAGRAHPRGR
jgi:bifunctional non-homologous end joining protein LigD